MDRTEQNENFEERIFDAVRGSLTEALRQEDYRTAIADIEEIGGMAISAREPALRAAIERALLALARSPDLEGEAEIVRDEAACGWFRAKLRRTGTAPELLAQLSIFHDAGEVFAVACGAPRPFARQMLPAEPAPAS